MHGRAPLLGGKRAAGRLSPHLWSRANLRGDAAAGIPPQHGEAERGAWLSSCSYSAKRTLFTSALQAYVVHP